MKLRIVSYVLSPGGGERFTLQLLKALHRSGAFESLEFVSHGATLSAYGKLFSEHGIACGLRDIASHHDGLHGFSVPGEALEDCDLAWFPWVHYHRIAIAPGRRVVGTFHDGISFTEASWVARYPGEAVRARNVIGEWLASPATLVCSSRHWRDFLATAFDCAPDRLQVIPIAADHAMPTPSRDDVPRKWSWLSSPYLLCPAGLSSHKNHAVLFEAYARAGLAWPLVLTGWGADFAEHSPLWRRTLRAAAVMAGLRPALLRQVLWRKVRDLGIARLVPLGYLSDCDYETVLAHAACVVMPTLSEGGGSFPVEEAVRRGIPVICSDIPVMREHMARIGAAVMWFDPHDPAALAACLNDVAGGYPAAKARALAQVQQLHTRGWADVAADYVAVFRAALDRP